MCFFGKCIRVRSGQTYRAIDISGLSAASSNSVQNQCQSICFECHAPELMIEPICNWIGWQRFAQHELHLNVCYTFTCAFIHILFTIVWTAIIVAIAWVEHLLSCPQFFIGANFIFVQTQRTKIAKLTTICHQSRFHDVSEYDWFVRGYSQCFVVVLLIRIVWVLNCRHFALIKSSDEFLLTFDYHFLYWRIHQQLRGISQTLKMSIHNFHFTSTSLLNSSTFVELILWMQITQQWPRPNVENMITIDT